MAEEVTGSRRDENLVLDVQDLRTYFFTRSGVVRAVDGVNFTVRAGETLGIVGESGSGKSMTALSILGMVPVPGGRVMGGRILLEGEDLLVKTPREMREIRGRRLCLIPQDPMTSLDPVFSIGDQMVETLAVHGKATGRRALADLAVQLLGQVRIPSPSERLANYPHQMSGGMRQRVVGAMAISGAPRLLIADEPTTSLDATIQFQYLRLLKHIQRETGLSIIFITHDFGVVAKVCDRVAVMYAGRIVETADVATLFNRPSHPYTEALLRSVLAVAKEGEDLPAIPGQPPALDQLPPGCSFAPRCREAVPRCREEYPPTVQLASDHLAACWRRNAPD